MKIDYKPWRFFDEPKAFPYARIQRTSLSQKIMDTYSLMVGSYAGPDDVRLGVFDYFSLGIQFHVQALINVLEQMRARINDHLGRFGHPFEFALLISVIILYLLQALLFASRLSCGLILTILVFPGIVGVHRLAESLGSKALLYDACESKTLLDPCPLSLIRSKLQCDDVQQIHLDKDLVDYFFHHDSYMTPRRRLFIDSNSLPIELDASKMINRDAICVTAGAQLYNKHRRSIKPYPLSIDIPLTISLNPMDLQHLAFLKSCIHLNVGGVAAQLENEGRLYDTLKTLDNLMEMTLEWFSFVEKERELIPEDVMGVVFDFIQQKMPVETFVFNSQQFLI